MMTSLLLASLHMQAVFAQILAEADLLDLGENTFKGLAQTWAAKFWIDGKMRLGLLSCMTKHEPDLLLKPDLSLIFAALADPTRREILLRLADGPASLGALAAPSGFALPTIHRHVAMLQAAGLVDSEKSARLRICRARPETITAAQAWLARTGAVMAAHTDRLDTYLNTLQKDI